MSRKDITDAEIVRACVDFHDHRISSSDLLLAPWQLLMQRTGQTEKVVYAAMKRAERRKLIDCGVSLRTAWPTKAGRLLLVTPEQTLDVTRAEIVEE